MRHRAFSEHEHRWLAEAWTDRVDGRPTWTCRAMAGHLGCSQETLFREIRALGLPLRKDHARCEVEVVAA